MLTSVSAGPSLAGGVAIVRASTMVPAISASLRRHRRAWLVLALGSVALVGGGGAYLRWASWPARATVSGPGYILPLAFSPDGKTLATREVGTVSLRAAADGRARGTWMLYGGSAHVIQAEFTPDGRDLAVLWNDQAGPLTILVDLVDVATGKVRATIDTHLALANLDFLAFADGGRTLRLVLRKPNASGFEVVDCDLGSGRISSSRPLASPAASWPLAVSPDGRFLAVALPMPTPTSRGAVSVWDLEHDREAARLSGGLGGGIPTTSAGFTRDGATFGLGLDDGAIELWDIPTHSLRRTLRGHTPGYSSSLLRFAPDGSSIASFGNLRRSAFSFRGLVRKLEMLIFQNGRGDEETVVVDYADGRLLGRAAGEYRPTYTPDGRSLATSLDMNVILRDLPGRR